MGLRHQVAAVGLSAAVAGQRCFKCTTWLKALVVLAGVSVYLLLMLYFWYKNPYLHQTSTLSVLAFYLQVWLPHPLVVVRVPLTSG